MLADEKALRKCVPLLQYVVVKICIFWTFEPPEIILKRRISKPKKPSTVVCSSSATLLLEFLISHGIILIKVLNIDVKE